MVLPSYREHNDNNMIARGSLLARRDVLVILETSMLTQKNTSASSLAIAFISAVCLILVCLAIWNANKDRDIQLKETISSVDNVAFALAQHATETFKEADIVLVGVSERLQHDGMTDAALARMHNLLALRVHELPQLNGIFVYDENGRWIITSQPKLETKFNNSDREYFQYHRTHADTAPHIGPPVQSRSTGRWILTLSRRLSKPDGSFGGVILATLEMAYFQKFYDHFKVGDAGAILLGNMNGTMLLRRPLRDDSIGKDMANASVFRDFVSKNANGTATIQSAQDGVVRINSYRRLDTYPLFVSVAMSRDEVLSDWRRNTLLQGITLVVLMLGLVLIGRKLITQVKRRESAERRSDEARIKVENLNRSLEQLAMQDGLTSLANRRYFDRTLAAELARAVREQAPLSLLMLDVDHFKLYNDTNGHLKGDECLKQIADVLRDSLQRPADLAARYGGEEFALILPGCDAQGALLLAQRIRQNISKLGMAHLATPKGHVTVSIGVCSIEKTENTMLPADLIEAADSALYESKHKGRDQVSLYRFLPSPKVRAA